MKLLFDIAGLQAVRVDKEQESCDKSDEGDPDQFCVDMVLCCGCW
jgi:hypothetical protein